MTALPWFKCYPRDFREGMVGLTPEERGAYATVLMLVYERGHPIPDDDAWIAGHLWCSVRTWKKIRAALIVKRRLFAINVNGVDSLMDERAAQELSRTAGISTARSEAGKEGGKRSAAKRTPNANENSDLGQANASDLVEQAATKDQPDIQTIRIGSVSPPNGEDTGGEPPNPDKEAWTDGPILLVAENGMTLPAAKAFFGGLLKQHGLQARDLLGPIGECKANGTKDPKSYLAAAAQARARRRAQAGPAKRVGFV